MDRTFRVRVGIVIAMICVFAGIYSVRLFALQLSENAAEQYGDATTTTYTETVAAARGQILDRHGEVLVDNRATYSVLIQNFVLYNSGKTNEYLLELAQLCEDNGIEYNDRLPLSKTTPYTYTTDDLTTAQQYTFRKYLLGREWDADMTPENLANLLKDAFDISDEYSETEQRIIMGLRYELDCVTYANSDNYTLAEDLDADQLALIKELGIPGITVETNTIREFKTSVGAQLLGHVGALTAEDYESTYKALGYSMNAKVGVDGMEYAFEDYLHGTDGIKSVTVDSTGSIVDEEWVQEPVSGSNIVTTIDIGMQQIAEESLAARIAEMADGKEEGQGGYDAKSGAVVAMNIKTGEVLAAASCPTYDPNDYAEHFDELVEEEGSPLINRALLFGYAPGSTFKMITSLAALRSGVDPEDTVEGTGKYLVYDDYQPKCWIYPSQHGDVNMMQALAVSCNIYFFTVGEVAGIEAIDNVATSFGFGQHTGSELSETAGQMASPELKASLYDTYNGWYAADTLMAAIGQSDTQVSPLQLCRYTAALASKGTLYNATFLRRAVSSDYESLVYENPFTPVATGLMSDDEFEVIKEGMQLCMTDGTAAKYFKNYDIDVACKTGTAQHGNGGSDNAAFVCWAPADDPEIAIAVYVEHGDTGGYYATVAQDIMDYYFSTQDLSQEVEAENVLLKN